MEATSFLRLSKRIPLLGVLDNGQVQYAGSPSFELFA